MNKNNVLSFAPQKSYRLSTPLALASTFGSAFLKHSRTQIPRRRKKPSITEILISGSPFFCNTLSELLRITSVG